MKSEINLLLEGVVVTLLLALIFLWLVALGFVR